MRKIAAAFLTVFVLATTALAQELPEGVELETGRYQLGVSDKLAILLDTKTGQTWRFLSGGHWAPLFFDEAAKPWRGDTILPPSVDLERYVMDQRRKKEQSARLAQHEPEAQPELPARNEVQAPSEPEAQPERDAQRREQVARSKEPASSEPEVRPEPKAQKPEQPARTETQAQTAANAESAWKARLEPPAPKPITLSESDLTSRLQRLAEQETQRVAMATLEPLTLSDPYLTSKLRTLAVQDLQRLADASPPQG